MEESDERFFHRMTYPNQGYEGSCLANSGIYKSGVHILRGCAEDIECPRLVEFDNKHKTEQTHENA